MNQNTYAKAENFTGTGALTYESLQQSFDRNKALSESSANGTYTQENGVITLKTDGYDESTKEYIKDNQDLLDKYELFKQRLHRTPAPQVPARHAAATQLYGR